MTITLRNRISNKKDMTFICYHYHHWPELNFCIKFVLRTIISANKVVVGYKLNSRYLIDRGFC